MPFNCTEFVQKPALIGDEWHPGKTWSSNNNTLGDWDKCCETAAKVPQHLTGSFDTSSLKMLTAKQPDEKITPDAGYVSPNEDDRKSSEHTNSYDVSASQSPSNDGAQSDSSTDEHIDVECMTQTEEMDTDDKDDTILPDAEPEVKTEVKEEVAETVEVAENVEVMEEERKPTFTNGSLLTPMMQSFLQTSLPAPIAIAPILSYGQTIKAPTSEETKLLLGFAQSDFHNIMSEAIKPKKPLSDSFGFIRSGSSAFSNIERKELLIKSPPANNNNNNDEAPVPTISNSTTPTTTSASFCRPPGLGPVALPPTQNGQTPMLVCPICGFMCPSKFHFNSHMNTHGDHQCSMCDYTSRTEGRLKKHMRESHTAEEQMKAGLELEPAKESNGTQSTSPKGSTSSKDSTATSPMNESFNLSTTLASILDSTNTAIAACSTTEQPSALAALTLDMSATTPNLLSSLGQSNFPASALDHIKAISENPNFMPDNGMNLASALGVVSQVIKGEPASPEKQSSGESRRSSSGKIKIFKCKQCGHQSLSKDDQWAHARSHIPAEKQLNCQHCNFVTEYKHHLEYHYRNHIGSKPFQCKKCSYNCVNKSMLNSHMKSHTNHYQFRCMDCTYATKYCHSLKLHLKKYNHRRVPEGIEMNGGDSSPTLSSSDATITFSPIVKQEIKSETIEPPTSMAQPFPMNPMAGQGFNFANQMLLNRHLDNGLMNIPGFRNVGMGSMKCPVCDFVAGSQEEQMRHSMSHILNSNSVPTTIASLYNSLNLPTLNNIKRETEDEQMECEVKIEDDNTTESHIDEDEEMDQSSDSAVSPTGSSQGSSGDEETAKVAMEQARAEGNNSPAVSNDSAMERDGESADDTPHSPSDTTSASSPPHVPVPIAAPVPIAPRPDMLHAILQQAAFAINMAARGHVLCPHCQIPFNNQETFNDHMSYHTAGNPFKCSKCQYQVHDSLSFALHMFQARH
ncbi:hypothetical protein GCK72_024476 [Caenorhabditis remanei]|uniref:C2H2-type domain-containing protein n=1 Tax=Caenorhabditis remanei TaxID=31234 RepID=A0A6A5G0B9_CAERE|nr:hypothetical protein GCK72_024476 [Caenorhabditis remanei]KAF1748009.1 hypothetical protein GCK72_024476 [Caenorhabditis remanei]